MSARIRVLHPLFALCLGWLALGASGQDFDPGLGAGLNSSNGVLAGDRSAGLMAEATPVFEVVDENAYIVGPADILYVAMGSRGYKVMVSPDGAVIIDGFPPVNVAGKTLAETRRSLTQSFRRYFKGGDIQIALAQAKRFQVSVTGAVNGPGMHIVPAGTRVSNVIAVAGGASRQASQNVVIRHASGKETAVDLAGYYRDGNLGDNPYVSQGDHVHMGEIDYSKPMVYVQSEQGTRAVQMAPGDDVESIVARSIDFQNGQQWDHLNVFEDGRFVKRVDRAQAGDYVPPAGSTVEVRTAQMMVFVGGAVIAPGSYPYNPAFSILDYVSKAGITYNSASVKSSTVIDANGDVRKVNAHKEAARPGDHILVPRSGEAKTRDWVGLTASVSGLILSIVSLSILINQQQ